MRKPIRIALIALALAAAVPLLNRIVYGRSLRATLYEFSLRRQFATQRTAEEEIRRMKDKRAKGEKPYVLPDDLAFSRPIEAYAFHGMQVFTLNGEGNGPVALYLHGGAYVNGFNAHQWQFMDRLARETDCIVVAPAYHLAPFADYARAYRDLTALYRALKEKAPDRRLILMGDSAGGGLALGLAEYLVGAGEALPERLILFSPWVDVSMENPDIAGYVSVEPMLHLELGKVHGKFWAGDADTRFWMVSDGLLRHPRAALSRHPPGPGQAGRRRRGRDAARGPRPEPRLAPDAHSRGGRGVWGGRKNNGELGTGNQELGNCCVRTSFFIK